MNLREAAQQALEAYSGGPHWRAFADAMEALRAALAEPVQEPVAWTGYDLDGMVEAFSRVIEAHHSNKHPFHNPIDMDAKMALRILRGFIPAMKVYAAPPQRKPLTEEEIEKAYREIWRNLPSEFDHTSSGWIEQGIRYAERAHGISND